MRIKIMTYNIHSGKDINNKFSLNKIATTIKESTADIICLNEIVQNKMGISNFNPNWNINQILWLASQINYFYSFGRNLHLGLMNYYGNGALSKFRVINGYNHLLRGKKEQRGCLSIELLTPIGKINLLVTHLGVSNYDRQVQIEDIVDIINKLEGPKILMGDFNTVNKEELLPIESNLINIKVNESSELKGTYPSDNPTQKIDYIFCSQEFKIINSFPIPSMASDHLPLFAELEIY